MSSDFLFYKLPKHVQHLIDDAFSNAIEDHGLRSGIVNDVQLVPGGGGGFILESTRGGYITEDTPHQQISLELIPTALQLLDLPPDDDEILSAFKNAASGWTSASLNMDTGEDGQGEFVSRDDWRAVCAVLLEDRATAEEVNSSPVLSAELGEEDEASLSDDYVEAPSSSLNESSDDDYRDGRSSKQPRRRRRHDSPTRVSEATQLQQPTNRQRQTCLTTFALFFPDVPPADFSEQRIMVADLQRVSQLLGEKIKADEMVEMLDMFSTSPDKSMDLNDFTRMMIMAKLA
ncbi:hypothetical protein GALMADRAFT_73858 [Galerina marginata CBS 339.88]|uniref:EF-hand domain-containing protein n=1 Tax=Galerina marginata (strain CBS 339.88) TaxID=685588 RepID=A0A067SXT9_GALM3|nr:hypothetical protein GALMADRAFT_73858 [Galerina marginata CBS 339.88]